MIPVILTISRETTQKIVIFSVKSMIKWENCHSWISLRNHANGETSNSRILNDDPSLFVTKSHSVNKS